MIRRSLSAVAVLAVLALPALGASPPWTAAGTDESSVSLYALTPPFIGFSAAPTDQNCLTDL